MDRVEIATLRHLEYRFPQGRVVYEPNGRSTAPDFSVDDRIAVEATRLVKTTLVDGVSINVTERHPRTIRSLQNVIEGFHQGAFERSSFVGLHIQEPVDIVEARKRLKEFLSSIIESGDTRRETTRLCSGLHASVSPASSPKATRFRLGSVGGRDFVDWVGPELVNQCREAITRKSATLSRLATSFEQVWLAVSSSMTRVGTNEYRGLLLHTLPSNPHCHQLLLVNALRPERSQLVDLR